MSVFGVQVGCFLLWVFCVCVSCCFREAVGRVETGGVMRLTSSESSVSRFASVQGWGGGDGGG